MANEEVVPDTSCRQLHLVVDLGIFGGEAVEEESRGNVAVEHKSRKLEGRVEVGEQLLPGIPNEITLDRIAAKLPWSTFHNLSKVSRGWQRAIHSRQVYDARVRTESSQTLVVINHDHVNNVGGLALFSLSDGSWDYLPPIPGLNGHLPCSCQCSSLDGKLYVLGGFEVEDGLGESEEPSRTASAKVYMLDLGGQRRWKQCASMADPRAWFGCGVMYGKVYVFGGTSSDTKFVRCGSEVYDPESDAWSPIAPMQSQGLYHEVLTMGGEFFVHSVSYDEDMVGSPSSVSVDVYNPFNNQWRSAEYTYDSMSTLFMVGGKLHRLTLARSIDVYDLSTNSWKPSQTTFPPRGREPTYATVHPSVAVVVDDELLVLESRVSLTLFMDDDAGSEQRKLPSWLLRSQGLGCQNKDIEWQKVKCPLSFAFCDPRFFCAIHL